MHPEQAPGQDDAPKPATGGTSRAARGGSAPVRRDEPARDEQKTDAPRDPEENPALHTATNITPADHSMVESLGGLAPTDTHHAPEAAPADKAGSAEAGPIAVGSSSGAPSRADDAGDVHAPANLSPAKPGSTRKKKRRKRTAKFDWDAYVPPPPIPLDPVARSYWNLHLAHRSCFKLLTDRWMLARYCSYLSLWVMTRQVLDSKGLVYVRHQRARGNGQPPVESIRALPHADYLMRLEYVLIQHERALGIDRHDIFTMENRQTGPVP